MNLIMLVIIPMVVFGVSWFMRRRTVDSRLSKSLAILADVEAGRRCIRCESEEVANDGTVVRCQQCGTTMKLAGLQASTVSDEAIRAVTRPDRHH